MAKLWQFLEGHPKPTFSEKVQRGDQKNFFKNHPESGPRFKGANSILAQMSLSPKLHPLIMQRLKKILAQKAAPKLPELPSYGSNFRKVTQDPHFLKKCKGGLREIFHKSPKK